MYSCVNRNASKREAYSFFLNKVNMVNGKEANDIIKGMVCTILKMRSLIEAKKIFDEPIVEAYKIEKAKVKDYGTSHIPLRMIEQDKDKDERSWGSKRLEEIRNNSKEGCFLIKSRLTVWRF